MSSFETSRSLSVQPLWNDFSRKSAAPHREERLRGSAAASAVAYDEFEAAEPSVFPNGSEWSLCGLRRAMDLTLAFLGLLVFSPVFAVLAIAMLAVAATLPRWLPPGRLIPFRASLRRWQ